MCYREKKTKHSKLILELLSLAVVQYELFKCPRMVTKLTLQTAEEMMVTADYKDALQVDKLTNQNNFIRWGHLRQTVICITVRRRRWQLVHLCALHTTLHI